MTGNAQTTIAQHDTTTECVAISSSYHSEYNVYGVPDAFQTSWHLE